MVHGFLCLPGPASDGKPVAAYPSSLQFPEDGRRVRPSSHVEGHGAARGLDVEAHLVFAVLGTVGSFFCARLRSAAALPVARRTPRASGATEASLARPFVGSGRSSAYRWGF